MADQNESAVNSSPCTPSRRSNTDGYQFLPCPFCDGIDLHYASYLGLVICNTCDGRAPNARWQSRAVPSETEPTFEWIIERLNDHYWDSLSQHKALILQHVAGALQMPEAPPSATAPTKQIEDALSLSIHWLDCLRCHVHGEPRERFDAMLKGNREALATIRSSDGTTAK